LQNRDDDEEKAIKVERAKEWFKKFKLVGRQADTWNLRDESPVVRPVYGIAGVGKSYIVKHVYYQQVIHGTFKKFGWVDVPRPFNLREFSWRLLLDFHSGSLQHGSMFRIKDPVQECRELLQNYKCLIVIDGLQSTEDWDQIKAALAFQRDNRSRILVISYEESVATYCSKDNWWNVEGLEIDDALDLLIRTVILITTSYMTKFIICYSDLFRILHKCYAYILLSRSGTKSFTVLH